MRIGGFQKTTLLDYPEHVAATVFLAGCNFRCPFCHNADLVLGAGQAAQGNFSEEEILSFLEKRRGILQGVCVTGGEPTLSANLPAFLEKIKSLGYLVKLDTNGSNPSALKALYEARLTDYVAMDIKAGMTRYLSVCGLSDSQVSVSSDSRASDLSGNRASDLPDRQSSVLSDIKESIRFLIRETDADHFSYEFRTTCVKPLHTAEDFAEIAELIDGAPRYYLQSYVENDAILAYRQAEDSSGVLSDKTQDCMQAEDSALSIGSSRGLQLGVFSAFSKEELLTFADIVKPHVGEVFLRGVE